MSLLSVDNISIEFGGLKAVQDFSLELEMGELVAVIGPNGAGKTTTFNMLTGIYRPSHGTITLVGELLNGKSPHEFTAHGIARTFQNIRLFGSVSVIKKAALFAGGVLFGTAGVKILGSKDAKKAYVQATAAVLRAKDCVMDTVTAVQENAEDVLAEAKEINERRQEEEIYSEEDQEQEDEKCE